MAGGDLVVYVYGDGILSPAVRPFLGPSHEFTIIRIPPLLPYTLYDHINQATRPGTCNPKHA